MFMFKYVYVSIFPMSSPLLPSANVPEVGM